jgi:hypothetical protein
LTVLRDPRAGEQAEASPIVDSIFAGEENYADRGGFGLTLKPAAECVKHGESERFLARTRDSPGGALTKNLREHRQSFGTLGGYRRRFMVRTGLVGKKGNSIAGGGQVPIKSLGSQAREFL